MPSTKTYETEWFIIKCTEEQTDMREYKVQQFANVSETVTARNRGPLLHGRLATVNQTVCEIH